MDDVNNADSFCANSRAWLIGPMLFAAMLSLLLAIWGVIEPSMLISAFDQGGYSPVELATIPVFLAIIPLVWWKCPFSGSALRRNVLCTMVSVVAIMAVAKELDLHSAALHWLFPDYVNESGSIAEGMFVRPDGRPLTGTPFKMRVLTNAGVPLSMKAVIVFYFAAFFGTFAAGFAYLGWTWVKGVFALEPAAWAWGCFGGSGVIVQISDRLPSWLDHAYGLSKHSADGVSRAASLCTCLEEGGELMLAVFALLTIWLGHKALECGRVGRN